MFRFIKYKLFLVLSFTVLQSSALDTSDETNQTKINKLYQAIHSQDNNKPDSRSELYFNLGRLYARQIKYDSAYKYYNISLKIAHETNDTLQLAIINNIIGSFYYDCENYHDADNYYQESYNLFSKLGNPTGVASLSSNLGEIERYNGNYEKAIQYYFSAISINEEHKRYNNLSINHNNLGLTYAHLFNYDSSFYHLKLAENISLEHGNVNTLNIILNSLGTYYKLTNNYDSSYLYFLNAYKQSVSNNNIFQIKENSNGLSQLFEKTGKIDSAYYYFKIFKGYSDSILNNKNLMRMGLLMVENKLDNERRIEKIEQGRKELFYIIIVISILFVLVLILLLFINQRNKTRHSQFKTEHLLLERKYLNNELTNFALHISENNHLLEEIKESLKYIDSSPGNENQVNELKLKLNTELSNSQNKKILEHKVDEQHREFIQFLKSKHQSLTKSELKLCSLLKLNLSTKDIAAINKVSPQAVKTARYRLRKKLQVESHIRINDYLNSIRKD